MTYVKYGDVSWWWFRLEMESHYYWHYIDWLLTLALGVISSITNISYFLVNIS